MNNNRIVLPLSFQIGVSEANKKIKIPLKGKGTLETILFHGDSPSLLNGCFLYQKTDTKGIRIFAEDTRIEDDLTGTVTQEFTFYLPVVLVLNIPFQDTFLELWINNTVATAFDVSIVFRITRKEPVVKRES